MKKIKFIYATILMLGILVINPLAGQAQVQVTVKGVTIVQINVNGKKLTTVRPGAGQNINRQCEKELIFEAIYFEKSYHYVTLKKPAGDCKITLEKTSAGLVNTYHSEKEKVVSSPFVNPAAASQSSSQDNTGQWVNLQISNKTSKTLAVLSGPFAGVAIAPMDTSIFKVRVHTGILNFPIIINDSTTSKELRQVVVTRIVTQDMTVLEVEEGDCGIPTSDKVKMFAYNRTDVKIVFTNGIVAGVSLAPGGHCMKKLKLAYGFQNLVIEFYDTDGLKKRANLEKILTPQDRVISIEKSDLKKAYIIQQ